VLGIALVLVAVLGWAWERHARAENERALATVAGELAGRQVGIRCQGFWSELLDIGTNTGEVEFPAGRAPDHASLKREICKSLDRFRTASDHPELECLLAVDWSRWTVAADFHSPCARGARPAAEALTTLVHESMHLRGWTVEAQTQCYAIQHLAWTVVRLGGTREQGAAVARFALAQQPAMPSEYQSGECRSGGGLDLHPETPSFPVEDDPQLLAPGTHGPAVPG
jgi:hypothetical protein